MQNKQNVNYIQSKYFNYNEYNSNANTNSSKKRSQSLLVINNNANINYNKYYLNSETFRVISKYSVDIIKFSKDIQSHYSFPKHYLLRHEISSTLRTHIIEWIMEVFIPYKNNSPTFLLTVQIMDLYFLKTKSTIKENEIHLIAITCIFIASKIEDSPPLQMKHILKCISHNKYTESQISKQERIILKELNFDIFPLTINDIISTILNEFAITNRNEIKMFNLTNHLHSLNDLSLFFAKIMTLNEHFNSYLLLNKAIACIHISIDILRKESKSLMPQHEEYLTQWLSAVISHSQYINTNELINIYNDLTQMYNSIKQHKKVELFHIYKYNSINLK